MSVVSRRMVLFALLVLFALAVLTVQARSEDRREIGFLGTLVVAAMTPVQAALARVSEAVASTWRALSEIGELRVENQQLRRQVEMLSEEIHRLREQAREAERLERILGLARSLPQRTIAARVIARSPNAWYHTILLDRGSRSGISVNDPVLAPSGLVGRVMEVTPASARVLLISDPRSAVGALVQRSRDVGVVQGLGEGRLSMRYLTRSAEVQEGDLVVTSGLGGIFPRGLFIGTIVTVTKDESGLFQEAEVRPGADLDRLEEVLVVLQGR
ncbi:MAG: rod shape-determining protein MreC [Armatimonadota bacterium]|nr:rod shape-determining protein MreC [Armatimonadota bacterium]MDR7435055.1 rod shape-determining protein MreC [Armatimonadota bacterium]